MLNSTPAPTRSAAVELREERTVVREAYDFLDEKRLLLAAELLHQLEYYETLRAKFETLRQSAADVLKLAAGRHGLQGLSVFPVDSINLDTTHLKKRSFMGVALYELPANVEKPSTVAAPKPCNPSIEANTAREQFQELILHSTELAVVSGNLSRLIQEYRLTERRARALENIILPELEHLLHDILLHLEEQDLEDVVRVHMDYGV